jgi:hypothetical protein
VAKYVEVLKDARTHINALMAVLAVHGGEQHRKRTRTIADMLNRVLKVDAATPRDRRQFLGNREHDLSNARNEIYEEADKLLLDVGSACSNAWIKASAHAWAIVNPHKDLDNRTSALANLCALTLRNHFTATNANADSIAISLLDTDMFTDNGQHPNSYTSNLDHAIAFTHDIHAQECTKSYITKNPSDLTQELTDATYADLALATTLDVILNRTSAHHAHQSDELRAGRRHVCLCALMLALKLGEGARRKDSEQESLQQQYRTLYLSLALLEERIARNLPACESIWIVKEKNS